MQLHEFIQKNRISLMGEWEAFAKTLSPGRNMDVSSLRGQAEEILQAIIQDMSEPQSRDDQEAPAHPLQ